MEPWGSREKEPAERREAGTSLGTARGRQHFKKISKENLKRDDEVPGNHSRHDCCRVLWAERILLSRGVNWSHH